MWLDTSCSGDRAQRPAPSERASSLRRQSMKKTANHRKMEGRIGLSPSTSLAPTRAPRCARARDVRRSLLEAPSPSGSRRPTAASTRTAVGARARAYRNSFCENHEQNQGADVDRDGVRRQGERRRARQARRRSRALRARVKRRGRPRKQRERRSRATISSPWMRGRSPTLPIVMT